MGGVALRSRAGLRITKVCAEVGGHATSGCAEQMVPFTHYSSTLGEGVVVTVCRAGSGDAPVRACLVGR